MPSKTQKTLPFYTAITCSMLLHIAIVLIINFLNIHPFIEEKKTIPFQLISSDKRTSHPNKQLLSHSENSQAAQEYLTTLNESNFKRYRQQNNTAMPKAQSSLKSKTNIINQDTKTLAYQSPPPIQNENSNQFFQGLRDLFSPKKLQTHHTIVQVTTTDRNKMSAYELSLVNLLAREKRLYDPFHQILLSHKVTRLSYIITIQLFSNGQIRKASIKKSSGISEIDKLAQQIAYNVSPYPRPPKGDSIKNYQYNIPISYRQEFKAKDSKYLK